MNASREDVAEDEGRVTEFVREYLDNGLAVYDAGRRRLGTVTDYDRPGGCFVLRTSRPDAALCIPFSFVRKVRRGRVYLSKSAQDLSRRLRDLGTPEEGPSAPALRRLFRVLFSWSRVPEPAA